MTNKSLVITQLHQHLRIHHLWCLIPMLKCNDMPLTYILCPLPQLSFVFFFSYNFINSLSTDNIFAETHKGLKRVTLICLLCPMLVIIHFRKYHIWKEKKRQLTNQTSYTTWRNFTSAFCAHLKKMADKRGTNSWMQRKLSKVETRNLTETMSRILLPHHRGQT